MASEFSRSSVKPTSLGGKSPQRKAGLSPSRAHAESNRETRDGATGLTASTIAEAMSRQSKVSQVRTRDHHSS